MFEDSVGENIPAARCDIGRFPKTVNHTEADFCCIFRSLFFYTRFYNLPKAQFGLL